MLLFLVTFNKEFSNVLCEKPVIHAELLLELRIVVIHNREDGKRSVCKKCARRIVNCYRIFTELREASLEGGKLRHTTRRRRALHELIREPVLGVYLLIEACGPNWSDSKGEAAKKKALVKMKLKELCEDLQQRVLCF